MEVKEKVLEVMREAGKPVSAGEVEKLSGLDRKEIDKAFKELKKKKRLFLRSAANGSLPISKGAPGKGTIFRRNGKTFWRTALESLFAA